jgi:hypothetical protein
MDKPRADKLEIVRSLFSRPKPQEDAIKLFRNKYPQASEEILYTLAHHLYVDGHDDLLDMLCELELFLRGETSYIDYGKISSVIYHLYNYKLIEGMMPDSAQDVIDDIKEIKSLINEEKPDIETINKILDDLRDIMEGSSSPAVDL